MSVISAECLNDIDSPIFESHLSDSYIPAKKLAAGLMDYNWKLAKLQDIAKNGSDRDAIHAIAESNKMQGHYDIPQEEQNDPVYLQARRVIDSVEERLILEHKREL